MGSTGEGRIEPHPGIPVLSKGLEHAGHSRASGKGFPSCPSWSRAACPLLWSLPASPWEAGCVLEPPGSGCAKDQHPRGDGGGAGGALHPQQNPTWQVCPRADSACSSTALHRLCPPRGDRSQVARCSRRLPAPACQVWQRPGGATLPGWGWGCAPEPPLRPMAAAASAVGFSVPHCDFLRSLGVCIAQLGSLRAQILLGGRQGKWVSIIHLCELCPPCRTGYDKHRALLGAWISWDVPGAVCCSWGSAGVAAFARGCFASIIALRSRYLLAQGWQG